MDFGALASRMSAGLEGVRACLIVSGDGLSLGAHPENAEGRAKDVWDRLSAVGDPQRGFFNVGDELWVVARRGWYAALLIASPSVRPGIALDRLESYLKIAEEARVREAGEIGGPAAPEPAPRTRSPVRREAKAEPAPPAKPQAPKQPQPVERSPVAPAAPARAESAAVDPQASATAPAVIPAPPPPPPPPPPAAVSPEPEPKTPVSTPRQEPVSARVAEAPAPPQPEPPAPSVSPQPEQVPAAPEARVESPAQDEAAAVAPPVEAPSPTAPLTVQEFQVDEPSTVEPEVLEPVVVDPQPQLEEAEDSAPASGTEEVPSADASASTVEPEVVEPVVVQPEQEPRRVVLDMTMAEPAAPEHPDGHEVKESPPAADDASETWRVAEVDRVALTREFAQLFADMEGGDES